LKVKRDMVQHLLYWFLQTIPTRNSAQVPDFKPYYSFYVIEGIWNSN
jgi:hypothetical protein